MAVCEKCGTVGFDMRDMHVDQEKTFVGPCCVKADPAQLFQPTEVAYGVEFSSHMGLKAYASYGGLTVEFKKTREEIQTWLNKDKVPEVPAEESKTPDVMTSARPVNSKEAPN